MAEKQKPQEDIVKLAGRAMTHPETLKGSEIKRMAARLLDDQKNDPSPNKSKKSLTSQVVAKVGELIPDALKSSTPPQTRSTAPAKPQAATKAQATAKPQAAAKSQTAAKPQPAVKSQAPAKPQATAKATPPAAPAPAAKPKPASKPKTAPKK